MRIRVQCSGVGGEGRCVRELVPPPQCGISVFFFANGVGSVGNRGTKRLALPLAGMDDLAGSSRVEKKAHPRGHCIVSAGLL